LSIDYTIVRMSKVAMDSHATIRPFIKGEYVRNPIQFPKRVNGCSERTIQPWLKSVSYFCKIEYFFINRVSMGIYDCTMEIFSNLPSKKIKLLSLNN
jgi:hypothetical protein